MDEKYARMDVSKRESTPLEDLTGLMTGWDPRNCAGANLTNVLERHRKLGAKSDLPKDLEKTIEAVIAADHALDQTLVTLKARLGLSSGRTPEELCAEHGWRCFLLLGLSVFNLFPLKLKGDHCDDYKDQKD